MGNTTNFGFPYPEGSNEFDVSDDIQELAESIDGKLLLRQAKKCIVAAAQSRSASTFDYLGTADKVTGIVMPTDGLIKVTYQATWKESVAGAAIAAIHLGANELQAARVASPSGALAAWLDSGANIDTYAPLASNPMGLHSVAPISNYSGDATTGQVVGIEAAAAKALAGAAGVAITTLGYLGGQCLIFADAGTYEVGVKFKASSGSVTAKNRRLIVEVYAGD